QVHPPAARLAPDQQIEPRKRETHRGVHRPDNGNPTHRTQIYWRFGNRNSMPETIPNGRAFRRLQFRSGHAFPSPGSRASRPKLHWQKRERRRGLLNFQRDSQLVAILRCNAKRESGRIPLRDRAHRERDRPSLARLNGAANLEANFCAWPASGKRAETRPLRVQNNPVRNMTSVQPSTTSIPAPLAAAASSSFSAP